MSDKEEGKSVKNTQKAEQSASCEKENCHTKPCKKIICFSFIITWLAICLIGYNLYTNSNEKSQYIKDLESKIDILENQQKTINDTLSINQKSINNIKALEGMLRNIPLQNLENSQTGELSNKVDKKELDILSNKVNNTSNKIEDISQHLSDLKDNNRYVMTPMVVAAMNIRDRINNGNDFSADIKILENLSQSDEIMQQYINNINRMINRGVVGVEKLRDELSSISDQIIESSKPNSTEDIPANQTIWDVIAASFASNVRIKDSNNPDTKDAQHILKNVDNSVKYGNLSKAQKEIESLSNEAKEAAQEWIEKLNNLHEVNLIFNNISDHLSHLFAQPVNEETQEDSL